jgi:hypothetical protein
VVAGFEVDPRGREQGLYDGEVPLLAGPQHRRHAVLAAHLCPRPHLQQQAHAFNIALVRGEV